MADGPQVRTEYVGSTKERDVAYGARWWTLKGDVHESVLALIRTIQHDQTMRRMQLVENAKLYANDPGPSLTNITPTRRRKNQGRVSFNVIRSCINTVCAKIAKNKPSPLFLTNDGDWSLQDKAEKLTKYCDGVFDEMDVYRVGQSVFRDACVFGTGLLRLYTQDGHLHAERVQIDEIYVDDMEGLYGTPRQMHQKRLMHRDELAEMFPKFRQEIQTAKTAEFPGAPPQSQAMIEVAESWHLKSGIKAKDGVHAICIDNATLLRESYDKDYFPFVALRWEDGLTGYYGTGLADELAGIQNEINRLLRDIQQGQHRMCVPRVLVEKSSDVDTQHINNEIGAIIKYSVNPPMFVTAPGVSPEIYQHLDRLVQKAYEMTGISMLSAQAKKPAGLDSGVALRENQDIESERFVIVGQRLEKFYLDVARVVIDLSRDMYENGENIETKGSAGKFIETIKFSDVNLEDERFCMKIFPVSMLPTTPAGRLQTAGELLQLGAIEKEQFMDILDFPDLKKFTSLETAALDDARMVVDAMLNGDEYIPPEPQMNLPLTMRIAQSSYLRGKMRKVSEHRLENLRTFMDDIQALLHPEPPANQNGPPVGNDNAMPPMANDNNGAPPPAAPPLPMTGTDNMQGPPPGMPPMMS